jgi:hypothetical protein
MVEGWRALFERRHQPSAVSHDLPPADNPPSGVIDLVDGIGNRAGADDDSHDRKDDIPPWKH